MNFLYKIVALVILTVLIISCGKDSKPQSFIGSNAIKNANGRNDQWSFIGPGGGGAMFNPAINPSDSNNVFVSSDMTGSFVTYDGGEKWRMFNLRGVINFYAFDKNNTNTVYAGTSNVLYKSDDKGVSWKTLYPRPDDIVAIHSQGDHATERIVVKDSSITKIEKLIVDPDSSNKLYLLVRREKVDYWSPTVKNKSRFYINILTSEDGGKQWKVKDKLPFDISNFFVDPTSPKDNRTIYVAGKDGLGMRKNGQWSNLGLPDDAGSMTQIVGGLDTSKNQLILYVIFGQSYFNPKGNTNNSRVYLYNTNQNKWERIGESLQEFKSENANDPEFRSIATSYNNPSNIYISYNKLQKNKDSISIGVAKSEDYGKSWKLVWEDVNNIPDVNRTSGWLDERFGSGWGENPFHMAIDDNNPNINFATDFGRTIKTSNGGKTWQQVYTNKIKNSGWKSRGLQVTTGYLLAHDPFDSLHVFMADTDTGLMESFDGTKTWSSATKNNGVPKHWVNSTYWIVFDPKVKDKVWAVMSGNHDLPRPKMWKNRNMNTYVGGVLVSTNGGKTWKPKSDDIGETAPTHLIIDNNSNPNKRTLYVCAFGKGVYKSIDEGNSWQLKNNGIFGEQPATWRLTQNNNGNLYLVVSRKSDDGKIGNDEDGALYKSIDGAETWKKIKLPKGANGPTSLIIDPDNPKRLILSAWGRYGKDEFSPNRGGGIYLSEDDGSTWKEIFVKDQHIHDLTIDERNGVFYACGFNSSAYRSEDKGVKWKRIKGYNFKWGKRVQPDPFNPGKIYIITFGGGIWYGPAKGDAKSIEDIITPVTSYK